MEEKELRMLGMTSLTIENLEEGEIRLKELDAEIKGLETEKSGYEAQREEAVKRLEAEKERTAPIKAQYDDEMKKTEKKNEYEIGAAEYRVYALKSRHVYLDPQNLSTREKRQGLEKEIAQAEEELSQAKKKADEAVKEVKKKYKEDFKEIKRIDQEISSLYQKTNKIDKRLNMLSHLYRILFWEVDRLKRNREYFEKEARS